MRFIFWIWVGNVRKNPKLSGTTHNVFGIQVGVSINLLHQEKYGYAQKHNPKLLKSSMHVLMNFGGRKRNITISIQSNNYQNVEWKQITPDNRYTWLTEGLHSLSLIPLSRWVQRKQKRKKGLQQVSFSKPMVDWYSTLAEMHGFIILTKML